MFKNTTLRVRLVLLISVQLVVLVITGALALPALERAIGVSESLQKDLQLVLDTEELARSVSEDVFAKTLSAVQIGLVDWAAARDRFAEQVKRFDELAVGLLKAIGSKMYVTSRESQAEVMRRVPIKLNAMRAQFPVLADLLETEDGGLLETYVFNDFFPVFEDFGDSLVAFSRDQTSLARSAYLSERHLADQSRKITIAAVGVGLFLVILLGVLIYRSIAWPVRRLVDTVNQITEGDLSARAELESKDELGLFGSAFDAMVTEKVETAAVAERKNEELNNSIIQLLHVTAQLGDRDLTTQATVTEDVTGPVADAINRMVEEISHVLVDVRRVADRVSRTSMTVRGQGQHVSSLADEERSEIARMSRGLESAARAMAEVAKLAKRCNDVAGHARQTSQQAMDTVNRTVSGMNNIREIIRETEKRIKRLGERSQEISGIVDIIKSVSERTHVLALNASMQAAAAGEAGRGFSVVADEVQRLAESSREATTEISKLVQNIQVETGDTIVTMNNTITQVVDGSRLTEEAGQQMKKTQTTTGQLADSVEVIAAEAQKQARVALQLRARANRVRESTEQTAKALGDQSSQTEELVSYSAALINSVGVFKLPEDPAASGPTIFAEEEEAPVAVQSVG